MRLPRLMIAGTGSGCGKTTITCGMLRLLHRRGLKMAAFKCGPDYIDPLYHREVLGIGSRNLDSFFSSEKELVQELAKGGQGCDLALIEGVMGYYDGLGITRKASCAEIAELTNTPVLLVLDAAGRSSSLLAELQGFLNFSREGKQITGVLFNRLSPSLYEDLAMQARKMGVCPCGYLPKDSRHRFESRHLGLTLPMEKENFREEADALADWIGKTADMEAILSLADRAQDMEWDSAADGMQDRVPDALLQDTVPDALLQDKRPDILAEDAGCLPEAGKAPRIAIARDAAFCFYYEQNIEYLEQLGCRIIFFSPLEDGGIPACDGLILPGGYPELYAARLSENVSMRQSIRNAVIGGLPTIAECGGYLYLHRTLYDAENNCWPMAGVFEADCRFAGFQRQFGYVNMTTQKESVFGPAGTLCRGHEFHYYISDDPGTDTLCEKPDGSRNWRGSRADATLYAGFTHLWLMSCPQAALGFVNTCRKGQNLWNG